MAWAFTCASKDKREAVPTRRAYCKALQSLVEVIVDNLYKGTYCAHYAGNRPEYSAWAQVCKQFPFVSILQNIPA